MHSFTFFKLMNSSITRSQKPFISTFFICNRFCNFVTYPQPFKPTQNKIRQMSSYNNHNSYSRREQPQHTGGTTSPWLEERNICWVMRTFNPHSHSGITADLFFLPKHKRNTLTCSDSSQWKVLFGRFFFKLLHSHFILSQTQQQPIRIAARMALWKHPSSLNKLKANLALALKGPPYVDKGVMHITVELQRCNYEPHRTHIREYV